MRLASRKRAHGDARAEHAPLHVLPHGTHYLVPTLVLDRDTARSVSLPLLLLRHDGAERARPGPARPSPSSMYYYGTAQASSDDLGHSGKTYGLCRAVSECFTIVVVGSLTVSTTCA